MNKSILIFSVLFIAFMNIKAQDPALKFHAGAVAGLNFSQVDGDDWASYNKVGLNAGFISEVPLSKHFFVSAEILYSQKGSKSPTYKGVPLTFKWKLNYAEIPVLINFQEKKAINFGAGLSYAQLLKAREFIEQLEQPDPTVGIGRSDIDILANANYLITKNFQLNVRFAYSIFAIGHRENSNFKRHALYNNLLSARLMWII
ncbi:MAG: PorT family protein [Chitinophagales bacterium]|nr:PorT family protein [Chitinophagales bacterium]